MAYKELYKPPKLADRLLNWFCKDSLLEEIEGDLFEHYQVERAEKPRWKANLAYWFHMLNFIRPFALKKLGQHSNIIIMYRSYIKTGFRNLKKQRLSSFINVFGLSMTIAIAVVVYVLVEREYALDKFHFEAEKVFAIQSQIDWNGQEETWGKSPLMLGQALKDQLPQIDKVTRVDVKSAIVRFNENVFNERLTFADPSYLDVFSFPLERGSKDVLEEKNSIIISQENAQKYFNQKNPIGEQIKVIVNNESYLFTVSAVAAAFPSNASFKFGFLASFQNLASMYDYDLGAWKDIKNQGVYTFVKLDAPESIDLVTSELKGFEPLVNAQNKDWPVLAFKHPPLPTLARNSQFVRNSYTSASTPQIILMFAVISFLLLVSAVFNYVNISVSMAQRRFSEIAIRKVIGGQRKQLVAQFMTENYLLCLIATITGFFLASYLFLPGISTLFQGEAYSINIAENPQLLGFLALLFVCIGLASGAYPALYISAFKPVAILGGQERSKAKNRLTRFFLFGQFFLTFFAVVFGFLFTSINEFQINKDWGYNPKDLIVVRVNSADQYTQMAQIAQSSPRIEAWAGSTNQVGLSTKQETVRIEDKKYTVQSYGIDDTYIDLLEFDINEGRAFQAGLSSDKNTSIIVNRSFLKKMNLDNTSWDKALVRINEENFNIVGIAEDFHFEDFFNPINASIFRLDTEENFNYITFKSVPGAVIDTEAFIKKEWNSSFPDTPYTAFFQENMFDNFFASTGALNSVMNFVAIVAIILSSMGLFGLVSLIIIKRIKEYSIRKVLGADSTQIIRLASKEFLILMGLAIAVGLPLSYFFFDTFIQQVFPGSIDSIGVVPYIITIGILLMVIVLTVSSHVIQLLRLNPVKNLRLE